MGAVWITVGFAFRSNTWLMPIEATSPQPNASTNSSSDFGRMIPPVGSVAAC
jgi:hypothetical protein